MLETKQGEKTWQIAPKHNSRKERPSLKELKLKLSQDGQKMGENMYGTIPHKSKPTHLLRNITSSKYAVSAYG